MHQLSKYRALFNGPSLLKDSSFTLITRVLIFGVALGTNIVLARTLGPSQKGIYDIVLLIPSFSALLVMFGFDTANVFFGARDKLLLPTLVGNSVIAAIICGILAIIGIEVLLIVPFFSQYLQGRSIDTNIISWLALLMPLMLISFFVKEVIRAAGDILQYNLASLSQGVTQFVIVIFLVWFSSKGLVGAIWAWSLSQIIVAIYTLYIAIGIVKYVVRVNLQTLKASFHYGIKLYPGNIAQFLNYRIDIFLVAFFLSPAEVGFYALSTMLAEKLWEFPHAIRTILLQRVAQETDNSVAAQITMRITRVSGMVVAAACILIVVFAYPLVTLLFGKEFLPTAPALIALMPGIWALSIGKLWVTHLSGVGHPEVGTYSALLSLIATLGLDLLLIPKLGIVGAAIASSISYSVASILIGIIFMTSTGLSIRNMLLPESKDLQILANLQ